MKNNQSKKLVIKLMSDKHQELVNKVHYFSKKAEYFRAKSEISLDRAFDLMNEADELKKSLKKFKGE